MIAGAAQPAAEARARAPAGDAAAAALLDVRGLVAQYGPTKVLDVHKVVPDQRRCLNCPWMWMKTVSKRVLFVYGRRRMEKLAEKESHGVCIEVDAPLWHVYV